MSLVSVSCRSIYVESEQKVSSHCSWEKEYCIQHMGAKEENDRSF